jgi:hypothetical protein
MDQSLRWKGGCDEAVAVRSDGFNRFAAMRKTKEADGQDNRSRCIREDS